MRLKLLPRDCFVRPSVHTFCELLSSSNKRVQVKVAKFAGVVFKKLNNVQLRRIRLFKTLIPLYTLKYRVLLNEINQIKSPSLRGDQSDQRTRSQDTVRVQ